MVAILGVMETHLIKSRLFPFPRLVLHRALHGPLPGAQSGPGPVPAEEQHGGLLPVPSESQAERGEAAEPGPAAS